MFGKLPVYIHTKFNERFALFCANEFHLLLNNHSLHGKYGHMRSINITGDYRALYTKKDSRIIFVAIGTHSELYA